jgi:hypothetical protein
LDNGELIPLVLALGKRARGAARYKRSQGWLAVIALFRSIVYSGRLSTLQWFWEHRIISQKNLHPRYFQLVSELGDLKMLEFLTSMEEHFGDVQLRNVLSGALRGGNAEMLRWALDRLPHDTTIRLGPVFGDAAHCGYTAIAEYLCTRYDAKDHHVLYRHAVKNAIAADDPSMLQTFLVHQGATTKRNPVDFEPLIERAALSDAGACLRWLLEQWGNGSDDHEYKEWRKERCRSRVHEAIHGLRTRTLVELERFIGEKITSEELRSEPRAEEMLDKAAGRGDCAALAWLFDHGLSPTPRIIAYFCAYCISPKLETLQWLIEHGCVADELASLAARHMARFDLLVWLKEHGAPMHPLVLSPEYAAHLGYKVLCDSGFQYVPPYPPGTTVTC